MENPTKNIARIEPASLRFSLCCRPSFLSSLSSLGSALKTSFLSLSATAMGNANPVSPATKREIEELIKAIIGTHLRLNDAVGVVTWWKNPDLSSHSVLSGRSAIAFKYNVSHKCSCTFTCECGHRAEASEVFAKESKNIV